MNYTIKRFCAALLAGLMLTGCSSPAETAVTTQQEMTTIIVPESAVPEYQWTTAARTEPDPESGEAGEGSAFNVSPYKLSASLRKMMSDDAQKDYSNLITAIMLGDQEVRIGRDSSAICVQALYDSFPGAWLLESLTFTPDEPKIPAEEDPAETEDTGDSEESEETAAPEPVRGTLSLQYRDEKADYLKKMEEFFVRTGEIMQASGALSAQTPDEAALLLYRYVIANVTDWAGSDLSSYGAIMRMDSSNDVIAGKKYAPGGTQAAVLTYLWLQIGVESALMTGKLNGSDRTWCAFSLDGQWYHCDPNCEMIDTNGGGLHFYGMTDAYRKKEGMTGINACGSLPEQFHAEETDTLSCRITADSERYNAFRQCSYAELMNDHEGVNAYYIGVFEPTVYRFAD